MNEKMNYIPFKHTIDALCISTTRSTASTFNPGTYRGEGTLNVPPKDFWIFASQPLLCSFFPQTHFGKNSFAEITRYFVKIT